MHQLIASYLFQHKSCPFPGLGSLSLSAKGAEPYFSDKIINAPTTSIDLVAGESDIASFLAYIASQTNSDHYEAASALDHFCDGLKNEVNVHSAAKLEGVGEFVVNSNGDISFVPLELPKDLVQPVRAERVLRPQSEHNILVGDKEKTNYEMTELLNDEVHVEKESWWIYALILAAIGLSMLFFHFYSNNMRWGSTGNQQKVEVHSP